MGNEIGHDAHLTQPNKRYIMKTKTTSTTSAPAPAPVATSPAPTSNVPAKLNVRFNTSFSKDHEPQTYNVELDLTKLDESDMLQYALKPIIIDLQRVIRKKETNPSEIKVHIVPRPGSKIEIIETKDLFGQLARMSKEELMQFKAQYPEHEVIIDALILAKG